MKNHIKVNVKLFKQTNKQTLFRIAECQKDRISTELYKLYYNEMKERRATKKLPFIQYLIKERLLP